MTRAILLATVALTWLIVVAQPLGGLVQAWLMDRIVFGGPDPAYLLLPEIGPEPDAAPAGEDA